MDNAELVPRRQAMVEPLLAHQLGPLVEIHHFQMAMNWICCKAAFFAALENDLEIFRVKK